MEKTNHDLQLQSRENVPARRQNDGYLRVYQSVFMFVLTLNLESKLRPGKLKVHTHTHTKSKHTGMHAPLVATALTFLEVQSHMLARVNLVIISREVSFDLILMSLLELSSF